MSVDPAENKRRLQQTLHTLNTSPKRCLTCRTVRPASQYKCECGTIKTTSL